MGNYWTVLSVCLWGVFALGKPVWAEESFRHFQFSNENKLRFHFENGVPDFRVTLRSPDGAEKPVYRGKNLLSFEYQTDTEDRGEIGDIRAQGRSGVQEWTWFQDRKFRYIVFENGAASKSCIPEDWSRAQAVLIPGKFGTFVVESYSGEKEGTWIRKVGTPTCFPVDSVFHGSLASLQAPEVLATGILQGEDLPFKIDLKDLCLRFHLNFSVEDFEVKACGNLAGATRGVWLERVRDHKVLKLSDDRLGKLAELSVQDLGKLVRVEDDILSVDGVWKKIDLLEFDAEVRMFGATRPAGVVFSPSGPVDVMAKLETYTDIVADSIRFPDSYPETPDLVAISRIARALRSQSAVVLGKAGSGKSSTVKAFARRVGMGLVPGFPRTTRIYEIDLSSFASGTRAVGTIEERISTLKEAAKQTGCFYFFDEMHSMAGVGTHSNQENDITQYIKGPLEKGEMRILGTDTPEEFEHAFAKDEAFVSRFAQITAVSPEGEALLKIIRGRLVHMGERVAEDAVLEKAVELSNKYDQTAAQPRAAVNLVKVGYALMAEKGGEGHPLTLDVLHQAVKEHYGFNPAQFTVEEMARRLTQLEGELDREIIGQEDAKKAIVDLWRRKLTGVGGHSQITSLMLVGPSGVGKSQAAGLSADWMGYEKKVIEMGKFSEGGVEEFRREVYVAIRQSQFRVFVLDEFEKAPLSVQQGALAMLEEGKFVVTQQSAGRWTRHEVNTRNALFFLTSNAAEDVVKSEMGEYQAMDEEMLRSRLATSHVSRALISRIVKVVPMGNPTRSDYSKGIDLYLSRLLEREGAKRGLTFVLTNAPAFKEALLRTYDGDSDFRRLQRQMNQIEDLISRRILRDDLTGIVELKWIPEVKKPTKPPIWESLYS